MFKTLLRKTKIKTPCKRRDHLFVKGKDDIVSLTMGLVNMSWATFICAKLCYEEYRLYYGKTTWKLQKRQRINIYKNKRKNNYFSIWVSYRRRFFLWIITLKWIEITENKYQIWARVKLYCKPNILPQIIINCVTSNTVKGQAGSTKSTGGSCALAYEPQT